MVAKKHKSKRLTLKDKYKIQKKVREHRRKLRRAERKNPKKRKLLPIIIPNNYPLKQQLLEQIQRDELNEKKELRKVNELAHNVKPTLTKKEKKVVIDARTMYLDNFKEMIKSCSIVFEILDVRDPLSTRSISVEKQILEINPNIKLVLVLNKIDLVPKISVENWLKYFRKDVPTIAFKSTIPNLSAKKKRISVPEEESLGHETFSDILRNYFKSSGDTKPIQACVIGFHGVGKTQVIESLKKISRLNPVYAVNHVEEDFATINKKIKIFDTEGYELDFDQIDETKAILQNLISPQDISDPSDAILEIIIRITPQKLSEIYSISEFEDVLDFLNQVGIRKGRLAPGGVTNIEDVVDLVLNDWNAGKLRYYTVPPKNLNIPNPISNEWVEKININQIYEKENEILFNLSDDTYNFSEFPGTLNNLTVDIIGNSDNVTNIENDEDMNDVNEIQTHDDLQDDMEDVEEADKIPKKKNGKQTQKNQSQKKQPQTKPKSIKKVNNGEDFNFATDFWEGE